MGGRRSPSAREPSPTAAALAAAFGLRRTGPRDYNGPCPLCGGRDRFHVRDVDGRAVFGCRGCSDGGAPGERSARYGEVLRLYRGEGLPTTRHTLPQAGGPDRPRPARDVDRARQMWVASAPISTDQEHPARRWLAECHLWRAHQQLPPSVRWLEAAGRPLGRGAPGRLRAARTRPAVRCASGQRRRRRSARAGQVRVDRSPQALHRGHARRGLRPGPAGGGRQRPRG